MELFLWLSVWKTASIVDVETSDRVRAINEPTVCKGNGDHLPIFDSSELSGLIGEIACFWILLNCDIKYAYCLKDNWILTPVTLCTAVIWCMCTVIFCIYFIGICTISLLYHECEINILSLLSLDIYLTQAPCRTKCSIANKTQIYRTNTWCHRVLHILHKACQLRVSYLKKTTHFFQTTDITTRNFMSNRQSSQLKFDIHAFSVTS